MTSSRAWRLPGSKIVHARAGREESAAPDESIPAVARRSPLYVWYWRGKFFLFRPIYLQQLGAPPLQTGVILGAFCAMTTLPPIPPGSCMTPSPIHKLYTLTLPHTHF